MRRYKVRFFGGNAAGLMGWIGLGIGMVLVGCSAEAPVPVEEAPRAVRTAEVVPSTRGLERVFSGRVVAPDSSRLSFRVSGRLVERPIEIGTSVRRGQPLAQLEKTDFRLRLERALAGLERAEAGARESEANYARASALYAGDNASRDELDRALAAVEQARGAVDEAERAVALARREFTYTRLEAPMSGKISDLFAEIGENVQAGQVVATLAGGEAPLEVEWTVPEGLISRFQQDLEVQITLPALSVDQRPAVISEVGAAPREGGTAFPVVAQFAANDDRMRSGMAAEVHVRLEEDETPTLLVPAHAVTADPRGRYVFVVDEAEGGAGDERTVRRRQVTVGRLSTAGLEVLTGLEGGETVVAAGVTFLDDGQTVRLLRGDPLGELPTTALTDEGQQ